MGVATAWKVVSVVPEMVREVPRAGQVVGRGTENKVGGSSEVGFRGGGKGTGVWDSGEEISRVKPCVLCGQG